ncbi:MAG TPA: pantoate--beta-alanine ligase [Ilumatobacter sp.]|nr:pantoate--beta-alanine ligase [Ilumatobacter sp.]
MDVLTDPLVMRAWSRAARAAGASIAVVPTMGALHAGHLRLVERAGELADRVVVTIFVNPLQFNQPTDFDQYPRPIDTDLEQCRQVGVAAVYAPTSATMYPPGFDTHIEPGALAARLEGPMRPGHFRGVTTVVAKLLAAVDPDVACFGEKDYQQLAIVRRMAADLDLGVQIEGVPTVREADGLAMSSRNLRLAPDDRAAAVVVPEALTAAADAHAGGDHDAALLAGMATTILRGQPRATVEYVEVVHPTTLEPVVNTADGAVILTAVWFGDVRLIDNRLLAPT